MSPFQKMRLTYQPVVPEILKGDIQFEEVEMSRAPDPNLQGHFPQTFHQKAQKAVKGKGRKRALKLGVVFSGGPAPGGHNVIAGLCDSGAKVIGFLGGPSGIVQNHWIEIGLKEIAEYRNQGGFDLLGTGRTKLETEDQLEEARKTVELYSLDGLVIIGGDDSNTNAAVLAEYFLSKGTKTQVIGVPKTIDGDLRSEEIEISFGFDSATKTYSELIGNIARDALSAKKYYHFIKLMGRSASHIALECALSTHPNLVLIGEERKSLSEIVREIADLICERSKAGKEYGVILIPEGLIEFIPEMKELFESFPQELQRQLAAEKDPHGNTVLSQIETEKLLVDLVEKELKKRKYTGKFQAQRHFFGYEGRSCAPSNFDANYCYALGLLAAAALKEGLTGMICAIQNLKKSPLEWELRVIPIVRLMHLEMRAGKKKAVIQKTLVDTKSSFFKAFLQEKKEWAIKDRFEYPGPLQFEGNRDLIDSAPLLLGG